MKAKLFTLTAILIVLSGFSFAQNLPVAVNDNFIPVVDPGVQTELSFNLLVNDYDPDGYAIQIKEVYKVGYPQTIVPFNDSSIILSFHTLNGLIESVYKYRICKVSDPDMVSNWAYANVNAVMSPDGPLARNDTFPISPGYAYELNVLKNDSSMSGANLYVTFFGNSSSDSSITLGRAFYSPGDFYEVFYTLSDTLPWQSGNFDVGKVRLILENHNFYDSLDINNISARFTCKGNHFWDFSGKSCFIVPKETGQAAIFSNAFWIGGMDEDENLHLAGERYLQIGLDYRHGPVSDVYDTLYDRQWHKVWNLNREEILYHKYNWWKPDYICPEDILTWPGNGDISNGQAPMLAPFYDKNNNGLYEPLTGDYPLIRGDQALFFIFNDVREPHTESGGRKLGIEVHGMAYAFDAPADSALWNTVFLHYDIINKSDTTYYDTFIGIFTDIDIGYGWDDFIGCDVQRGMYYGYNGSDFDPDDPNLGDPIPGYNEHLAAIGVVFLGGPYMDPDGSDNPSGGCDVSINGFNFGDGIADNERYGMTGFSYFNNSGGVQGDPLIAPQYYDLLTGFWKDGTPLQYGGNGHISSGATGPKCKFMFPGDTDPCNWGTGGIDPEYGIWTEETVGNNPGDRRGLGVTGPFTFKPGDVQQLDLAFAFARDYTASGNLAPIEILQQRVDSLRKMVIENGLLELPEIMSVQQALSQSQTFLVHPNPAGSEIRFNLEVEDQNTTYSILSVSGVVVRSGKLGSGQNHAINIQNLQKGIYFLMVNHKDGVMRTKFVKH